MRLALASVGAVLVPLGLVPATAGPVAFQDGFENGTSSWSTVRGVGLSNDAAAGTFSAQATATGSPAFARAALPGLTTLDYSAQVKLVSRGANAVTLLAVWPASGTPVASVVVNAQGRLVLKAGTSTVQTGKSVTVGSWHEVRLRVEIAGAASSARLWFNTPATGPATAVSTTNLGTTAVNRIQIGDAAAGRTFTTRFDSVLVEELGPASDTTPPSAPSGLTATSTSTTQVSLAWQPASDDVAVVGYDVLRDGTKIAAVGTDTAYVDSDVAADTAYSYTVRARDAAGNVGPPSEAASVRTPPVSDSPVIAAAGDIACSPSVTPTPTTCRQMATSDLLLGGRLERVLPLGDNQYETGSLAAFNASYHPSWGRVLDISSPVPGNHEYLTAGAAGYFDYFGARAGDPAKGYYSYDVGAWHVIALNSNCAALGPADGCAEGTPQNDWLEADLAANTERCTLAYWHHPFISSGPHGGTNLVQPFWADLYAANADVVLTGHSHNYERFAPVNPTRGRDLARGIRSFVVGTGGEELKAHTKTPPATSEVRHAGTFGVIKLTLHSDSYDWRFVPVAGSTFTDAGTEDCH